MGVGGSQGLPPVPHTSLRPVLQHGGVRGAVHQDGHHGQRPLPLPGQRPAPQEQVQGGLRGGTPGVVPGWVPAALSPSPTQVWGWLHGGGAGGRPRGRAGAGGGPDAALRARCGAAGAARGHPALPPALPLLLPGQHLQRPGSPPRPLLHPGLLRVPDHPRPGDGGGQGDGVGGQGGRSPSPSCPHRSSCASPGSRAMGTPRGTWTPGRTRPRCPARGWRRSWRTRARGRARSERGLCLRPPPQLWGAGAAGGALSPPGWMQGWPWHPSCFIFCSCCCAIAS